MKIACLASVAILAARICFSPPALGEDQMTYRGPFIVEVQLDGAPKFSRLRPGARLEGNVKRAVYSGEREVIPSGSPIELTVSATQRRRQKPSGRWPWVVRLLGTRKVNYPSSLAASVSLPGGLKRLMTVTWVSATREVELAGKVRATGLRHGSSQAPRASLLQKARHESDPAPTLLLEVERPPEAQVPSHDAKSIAPTTPEHLAVGTVGHVILLRGLRASTSHSGDTFLARLSEPVRVNSRVVLPEGVLVRGKVVRSVTPRWLGRPGSLSLVFTQLMLATGEETPIAASLSGAVIDRAAGMRMDAEGGLIGARPSKARLLIDLGVTGGVSKVADDSLQLVSEALISGATDASTAGAARIVAAAASGVYVLTRHGQDVTLPRYTNLEITFDRPTLLVSNDQRSNMVPGVSFTPMAPQRVLSTLTQPSVRCLPRVHSTSREEIWVGPRACGRLISSEVNKLP